MDNPALQTPVEYKKTIRAVLLLMNLYRGSGVEEMSGIEIGVSSIYNFRSKQMEIARDYLQRVGLVKHLQASRLLPYNILELAGYAYTVDKKTFGAPVHVSNYGGRDYGQYYPADGVSSEIVCKWLNFILRSDKFTFIDRYFLDRISNDDRANFACAMDAVTSDIAIEFDTRNRFDDLCLLDRAGFSVRRIDFGVDSYITVRKVNHENFCQRIKLWNDLHNVVMRAIEMGKTEQETKDFNDFMTRANSLDDISDSTAMLLSSAQYDVIKEYESASESDAVPVKPEPKNEEKAMGESNDVQSTLQQRGHRYGSFSDNASLAQSLKDAMRGARQWEALSVSQREALDMTQHKIARILNGDVHYLDNWRDAIGYLTLAMLEMEKSDKSHG